MRKKILTICISLVTVLGTGCTNSLADKAIEQGKLALSNKEYDKALTSFELALDEGADGEIAELVEVIKGYKEAEKLFTEGKLQDSEKALESIGSKYQKYSIKSDVDSLKESISQKKKETEGIDSDIEEIYGLIKSSKYEEAKAKIEEILGRDTVGSESQIKILNEQLDLIEASLVKKAEIEKSSNSNQTTNSNQKKYVSKKQEYLDKMSKLEARLDEKSKYGYNDMTTAEMNAEADYYYKAWDDMLNEIWGVLKNQLPADEMENLREIQRDWIVYRDESAKSGASSFEGGSGHYMTYVFIQGGETEERCYELVNGYMK
ncbi:hypothetical protein EUAN_13580 [Andreesenia angusta]|uniref:Lysozyme inhibitor LprI-like N-terminal domain-containing protein n=1 Tax=Andreesenia angusta TaxID=39480 RepID=A0A1S1V6N6_9FIRM|nr:lysozyme inhibitor LprI family protein [Andreesenia angusta]OHW62288.1 hypothetical protein EUAN_13580 [Andreesenia angusta]